MYLLGKLNFYQNNELVLNIDNLKIFYNKKEKFIKFKIDNFMHKISINEENLYFERKNDEWSLFINFKKEIAFFQLNNYNDLNIKILKKEIQYNEKQIHINYILETEEEIENNLIIEIKEGTL